WRTRLQADLDRVGRTVDDLRGVADDRKGEIGRGRAVGVELKAPDTGRIELSLKREDPPGVPVESRIAPGARELDRDSAVGLDGADRVHAAAGQVAHVQADADGAQTDGERRDARRFIEQEAAVREVPDDAGRHRGAGDVEVAQHRRLGDPEAVSWTAISRRRLEPPAVLPRLEMEVGNVAEPAEIGRASCRER